jgi:pretoxin HINT domain-containing protein
VVYAYDGASGSVVERPITDTIVRVDPEVAWVTIGGDVVETTPDHPFFTLERGWVEAGLLWPGAHVQSTSGSGIVASVEVKATPTRMWDLTVDEAHSFYVSVGEWLVHNDCYRQTFKAANPGVDMSDIVVHHAIEQQVIKRYPELFTKAEINAIDNLRGIPKAINNDVHLSQIRKAWNEFYRNHPNATREEVIAEMNRLDEKFGSQFNPPR